MDASMTTARIESSGPADRRRDRRFRLLAETIPQIVWTTRPDGAVDYLNRRWFDYTGMAPEQARGWGWRRAIHPDDLERCLGNWGEVIRSGRRFEAEYRIRRGSDGAYRRFLSRAESIRDDEGRVVRWFGTCTDIDDSRRSAAGPAPTPPALAEADAGGADWEDALAVLEGDGPIESVESIRGPDGVLREWRVVRFPMPSEGSRLDVGAGADVGERGRAGRELGRRDEGLAEAEGRRDEFLAMLAHELRNPLSAIGNALQLSRGPGRPEDRAWAEGVIERQVGHLSRLIDDLLDVSRVSRGRIALRKELVRISEVLDRVAETARPLMERHRHALTVASGPGALWAEADPVRLEQLFGNLLNNAAKYTEDGGRIRLAARREGPEIVVEVSDNGIGIAPEMLPRVFDLFTQADGSLDRAGGGLGIGLALARTLADLHGGRLSAVSDGLGRGSTFTVRMPASEGPPEGLGLATGSGPRVGGRGRRILVVDDNVDSARCLAKLLTRAGHDVRAVHDGASALEAAASHRAEVVLLDIGLPILDGYQVARRLRDDEATRDALIVAISGYGQDEDRRRSREAGFDHHLVKPVEFSALLPLLDRSRIDSGTT